MLRTQNPRLLSLMAALCLSLIQADSALALEFKDKVVLVTGGTSDIGRVIVEAFADAGAKTAMLGSDGLLEPMKLSKKLNDAGKPNIPALVDWRDDVAYQDVIKIVLHTFGRIDIWVNSVNASLDDKIEGKTTTTPQDIARAVLSQASTLSGDSTGKVVTVEGRSVTVKDKVVGVDGRDTKAVGSSSGLSVGPIVIIAPGIGKPRL